jgi:hypothetical protein
VRGFGGGAPWGAARILSLASSTPRRPGSGDGARPLAARAARTGCARERGQPLRNRTVPDLAADLVGIRCLCHIVPRTHGGRVGAQTAKQTRPAGVHCQCQILGAPRRCPPRCRLQKRRRGRGDSDFSGAGAGAGARKQDGFSPAPPRGFGLVFVRISPCRCITD